MLYRRSAKRINVSPPESPIISISATTTIITTTNHCYHHHDYDHRLHGMGLPHAEHAATKGPYQISQWL